MVSARASSALSRFRRWPRRSTPAAPRSRAARGSRLGSSWMAHAIAASSNGKSPSAQAPAAISTVSASSRPIRLAARSPLANFRSSTLATLPGVGNMPRKLAGREGYEVEANRRTFQGRTAGRQRQEVYLRLAGLQAEAQDAVALGHQPQRRDHLGAAAGQARVGAARLADPA